MCNLGNNKGIALFIVLGMLLVVMVLANVALSIVLNQSQITSHQVGRIQAYYAAQAAINYAKDKLRTGSDLTNWPITGNYTNTLCRNSSNCNPPPGNRYTFYESDLPSSVKQVNIGIGATGSGSNNTIQITATTIFNPS